VVSKQKKSCMTNDDLANLAKNREIKISHEPRRSWQSERPERPQLVLIGFTSKAQEYSKHEEQYNKRSFVKYTSRQRSGLNLISTYLHPHPPGCILISK